MDLSVGDLERALDAELRWAQMPPRDRENLSIRRIGIDTRQLQQGDLFWAIKGPSRDGNDYAHEAFLRGAVGVVSERCIEPLPGSFSLQVVDTRLALWQLASWWRTHLAGTIIAVAGSVGKTTAREMIHTVLNPKRRGLASEKNFNNHLGVPLSLLRVSTEDEYAVVEVGANAPGEIDALARLTDPQIGVITRLADAHLEGFGSLAGVAAAKTELLETLQKDNCAVLPGDDRFMRQLATNCQADITWFGKSMDSDIVATNVSCCHGRLRFHVDNIPFDMPVWGRHYLDSALAAVSVGLVMGESLQSIATALTAFKPAPMRCEVAQIGGFTVINDTYNASPQATKAALAMLREFGTSGRRFILCGDMLQLGDASNDLHYQLGFDVVTRCGADRLFTFGRYAQRVADGARDAGMPASHINTFDNPLETIRPLRDSLMPGDVMLAKASRDLRLERVLEALADSASNGRKTTSTSND